ncbi:hypothetical protein NPIL_394471 [Nephila pilipes]|uniref:Uncharacterized protein n=1 Tax=Nephila pilipes TaxID=299642 RepID=A0A8X6MXT1_NEPPI|nr:hypothetical protein NPIL_394471 [Nephila pilipes]
MEALTSTGMGRKPTDEKSLVTKRSTSCVIISTHRKADHVRFGLPVLISNNEFDILKSTNGTEKRQALGDPNSYQYLLRKGG